MQYLLPKKIISSSGNVANGDNLLSEKPLQIGLYEPLTAKIRGKAHIILDFGEELSGGARILTFTANGDKRVRLRFGESISETCAEIGEKNATNDHSLRDFTVELQNFSDMTFGQTGFRFLRLDFLGGDFEIKAVAAASDCTERETTGKFVSSDELLNDIWQAAAKTLKLCIRNGYLVDGIKRDRLVWIGDVYPEIKTAYCLFDDIPEIKNSLAFCRDQTPEGGWTNNIPSYSVWWLINLCEYYAHSGDDEFVKENSAFISRLIGDVSACVDDDGNVNFDYFFIDWATHPEDKNRNEGENDIEERENDIEERENAVKEYDEKAGTNYLLRIAFGRVIPLLKKFGMSFCEAEKTLEKLKRKSYSVKKYKQIAALGVIAGEKTRHNETVMLSGGAKGLSTFLNYFIFSALSQYNKIAEAVDMIKEYYGKMLELGATTFWEDFDAEWAKNSFGIDKLPVKGKSDIHGDFGRFCYKGFRHSLCHGWASGVLCYMTEELAGIKQTGFNEFSINPNLCGNLKSINCVYPTAFGKIEIYAEKSDDGSIKTKIDAPEQVKIIKN